MLRLRLYPIPIVTTLSRPNRTPEIGDVSIGPDVGKQWGWFPSVDTQLNTSVTLP